MTEKLKSNLPLWQFLLGLFLALVPVLVSLGMTLASFSAQGQAISDIQADRREQSSEWREWRAGVDEDRATSKANQVEILRRLDRIEAKLDR